MYRAVVDTNLIISGTASASSVPYHLLEAWRRNEYILVTSVPILAEVKEVFEREDIQAHFHITSDQAKNVIETFTKQAFVTPGELEVNVVKDDPDDNKFIAAAIEGSASYIISGDRHLLDIKEYEGIKIMKARNFLEDLLQKGVK